MVSKKLPLQLRMQISDGGKILVPFIITGKKSLQPLIKISSNISNKHQCSANLTPRCYKENHIDSSTGAHIAVQQDTTNVRSPRRTPIPVVEIRERCTN